MGPEDAARGLGAERTEGASWMRERSKAADKAFIVRE